MNYETMKAFLIIMPSPLMGRGLIAAQKIGNKILQIRKIFITLQFNAY